MGGVDTYSRWLSPMCSFTTSWLPSPTATSANVSSCGASAWGSINVSISVSFLGKLCSLMPGWERDSAGASVLVLTSRSESGSSWLHENMHLCRGSLVISSQVRAFFIDQVGQGSMTSCHTQAHPTPQSLRVLSNCQSQSHLLAGLPAQTSLGVCALGSSPAGWGQGQMLFRLLANLSSTEVRDDDMHPSLAPTPRSF